MTMKMLKVTLEEVNNAVETIDTVDYKGSTYYIDRLQEDDAFSVSKDETPIGKYVGLMSLSYARQYVTRKTGHWAY